MITYLQSIILGIMQGISELFPISSLGHTVLVPTLLGWNINQADPYFLNFLVATHLATAIVLFVFFWKDWMHIIQGFFQSVAQRNISKNRYSKLAWLLIVGTVPAGIIGFVFQKKIQIGFANPALAALLLIANGFVLLLGEILRKGSVKKNTGANQELSSLSFGQSFKVGVAQVIALLPGFSRSGSTLTGGLLVGLSHEDAARFSFLLATPIIGAAAVLKIPDLLMSGADTITITLVGAFFAALSAYISVKFLMKYFKTNTLIPFVIYCFCAGTIASIILSLK